MAGAGRFVAFTLALGIGLGLGLAGCDTDGIGTSDTLYSVTDSAGVEVVTNGWVGPWGPDPLAPVEVVRIGVVEGDEPYQFAGIRSMAVDAEDRIWVGNNQTGTVRAFDHDGVFLREFGGRGDGPGEFISLDVLHTTDEGIAVIDWQAGGRVGQFDAEGRLLDSWSSTRPDGSRLQVSHWTPRGWLAIDATTPDRRPLPPGTPDTTWRAFQYLDDDRELVDEPRFDLPPSVLYASDGESGRDWGLFGHQSPNAVDGSGRLYQAHGGDYRIEVFSPEGELVRRIERPFDPIPLGADDVEAHLAVAEPHMRAQAEAMGVSPTAQVERYSERFEQQARLPMPDHRGVTGRLLVDHAGGFWIERLDHIDPAWQWFERMFRMPVGDSPIEHGPPDFANLWEVFDADGRFLGAVELPVRFEAHVVDGLRVTGVERDELDVEYVVSYRVQP